MFQARPVGKKFFSKVFPEFCCNNHSKITLVNNNSNTRPDLFLDA